MANPASRAFYLVSRIRNLEYGVEDHVGKFPETGGAQGRAWGV